VRLNPFECISVCMPTGGTPLFLPPLWPPPYKNAKLRRKRPARLWTLLFCAQLRVLCVGVRRGQPLHPPPLQYKAHQMHRQSKDKKSANLVWTEKPAKFGLDKTIREFSLDKKIREVEGGGCSLITLYPRQVMWRCGNRRGGFNLGHGVVWEIHI
jgi:hypothetical protein